MNNDFGPLFDNLDDNSSHARKAREWMDEHPEAMRLFERLALQSASTRGKFGINFLAERIRWEFRIERRDAQFKINNNHRPYIARELVRRHPNLGQFIEMRTVTS